MMMSEVPDPSYSAPPPGQSEPAPFTDDQSRPPSHSNSGCWIAAAVGLIVLCISCAAIAGTALMLFWLGASPTRVTSDSSEGMITMIAPATETEDFGAAPTPGNAPTLTPVPTNTLPPAQPTSLTTPAATASATVKPTWMPCAGSKYSRLYVGDIAYVSFEPPLPNRVRSQPTTAGTYLGMLQPGEKMEIIGGPECAHQTIWWQVRSLSSGLTGWTAEGDSKDYWLVPAP